MTIFLTIKLIKTHPKYFAILTSKLNLAKSLFYSFIPFHSNFLTVNSEFEKNNHRILFRLQGKGKKAFFSRAKLLFKFSLFQSVFSFLDDQSISSLPRRNTK